MNEIERVRVFVRNESPAEFAEELRAHLADGSLSLGIAESIGNVDTLSLDLPTIIVSGAGVVSAFLTAWFTYLSTKRNVTLTIVGKSGRKLVVPVDTSKEDLAYYIRLSKEIDADSIIIE